MSGTAGGAGALPTGQVAPIHHRRIGDVLVTSLADGYLDAPFEILTELSADEADAILKDRRRRSPPRISINAFLLRAGGRVALVDTGAGDTMGPTLGRLPEVLAAAGVPREAVDAVLLTHMHPDHSNGLVSPDGERLFANAELVVGEADIAHWHDDGAMARADERRRKRYFEAARFQFAPYRDRVRPAAGEVFPAVHAVPLPGHTPGHTGYLVASGGQTLFIWGDVCHLPDIQVGRPETTLVFDTDPDAAIATRRRAFAMAACEGHLVAGMHHHFPGLSRIAKRGDAFELIDEPWAFTL